MDIKFYFNEEEGEYIKKQDKGYVRRLVQSDMSAPTFAGKKTHEVAPPSNLKTNIIFDKKIAVPSGNKGDGLHTCKTCGYMLTQYKGKCKLCGK